MSNREILHELFETFAHYQYRGDLKVLCTPDFYLKLSEEEDDAFFEQVSKSVYTFDQIERSPIPYGIPVVTTTWLDDDSNPCAIDEKRGKVFKLTNA